MIFVTVGNATQGFRRLLDAVEALARRAAFVGETVMIQAGNNPGFVSSSCRVEPFMSTARFEELIHEADIVVCHGGAGTLLHVLQAGKVPVVMPRLAQYGEIVDDHQVELVETLAAEGRVIYVSRSDDLERAIGEARRRGVGSHAHPKPKMLRLVERAIEELTYGKV